MAPRRRKELLVRRESQVRALSSPLRQAMVNALRRRDRASIRELAADLGRAPATLYYHARQLEQEGLLVEVERRETGKRPEAVYALVAEQIRLDRGRRDEAWHRQVDRLVRSNLRELERALALALRDSELDPDDPAPQAQLRTQRIRVSTADRRELQERLDAVSDFLERANLRAGADDPVLICLQSIAPAPDTSAFNKKP